MTRIVLLSGVFFCSLNLGVAEALGLNVSLIRIASETTTLVLLANAIWHASRESLFRALKWIGLPLLAASIGVVTAILNHAPPLEIMLFVREALMPLIFFTLFLIEPPNEREWKVLKTLLLVIAAIQLPIAALKYLVLGVNEKGWIGTFHQYAGQLGLLMPMLAVAFLWAYAIKSGRLFMPVLLATGFSLISVVNEKRAVILIMPLLVVFLIIIDLMAARLENRTHREIWYCKLHGMSRMTIALLLSAILVTACALRNIPSFDTSTNDYEALPSRTVIAYISEYLFRGYDSAMNLSANPDIETNRNIQMGRFRLWASGIGIATEMPSDRLLFGTGGGWLLSHPLLAEKPNDIFFHRLQLRGPTSTGLRHLFEMGAVGFLLMFAWMLQIGWALLRRAGDSSVGMIALGATGAWAILIFDYLIYSQVGWGAGVFAPLCFLIVARALQDRNMKG